MEQSTQDMLRLILTRQDEILALLQPKVRKSSSPKTTTPLEVQIEPYRHLYPPREIEKFINYWSEQNKRGTQLWQTKPTWEIKLRLQRWMMNKEDTDFKKSQQQSLKTIDEAPREQRGERIDTGFRKLFS